MRVRLNHIGAPSLFLNQSILLGDFYKLSACKLEK